MKYECKIEYALDKEEALLLTTLFKLMVKDYCEYSSFAKIKPQTAQSLECEFFRSWGFNYYYVNKDVNN